MPLSRLCFGPLQWPKHFPHANGKHQSPVDIDACYIARNPELGQAPLLLNYNKCSVSLKNTGEGWKISIKEGVSSVKGGPLEHSYQLLQFHCHWGKSSTAGSEHAVNEKFYAAELHLVHWNTGLYKTPEEATASDRGLAVVGIFLEVNRPHSELQKITDALPEITYKDDEISLKEEIDPSTFLPEDHAYWTYEGSLTTPPCYESVTWIVLKKPIEISEDQLRKFRTLCCYCKNDVIHSSAAKKVEENRRNLQPLNDRKIYEVPG